MQTKKRQMSSLIGWGHIAEEDRNRDRGDDGRLQCQVGDDNTGYI